MGNMKLPIKLSGNGMMENLPVLYTLTPKNTYQRFAKESWVSKMLMRRDYEIGTRHGNPIPWLPKHSQLCTAVAKKLVKEDKSGLKIFRYQCESGIVDYKILAKVGNRTWTNSEAEAYLAKYGIHKQASTLYKNFNTYKESAFENIGLKTYIFMANNLGTPYYSTYTEESASKLSQPIVADLIPGDGTVPTVSQLGPALKWAEEFDKRVKGAGPVKIIHYCNSVHRRASGTYEEITDKEWERKLWSNENAHLDLNCRCSSSLMWKSVNLTGKESLQMVCGHVGAWQDPTVRGFVQEVLMHGSATKGLTKFTESLDDGYLKQVTDGCLWEKIHFLADWRNHLVKKTQSLLAREDAKWRRLMDRIVKANSHRRRLSITN